VQWVLWAQFLNSEKWTPIGMKEAARVMQTSPAQPSPAPEPCFARAPC
jgi:hypothetical protein